MRITPRLTLPLAGMALVILAGCAPSDPPPTSPFDEADGDATAAPTATTVTPTATAPVTSSPPGPTGTPDDEALAERATGEAIARLAEWLGVRETDLQLVRIEEVEWPSACLGVEPPDIACAEVVTPGYRIEIAHAGDPNTVYYVHASRQGRYAWAPLVDATREIETVDSAGDRLTLTPLAGSDEMGTEHRLVPGSYLGEPLADFAPGDCVSIAVAPALPGESAALVVWLVRVVE